MKSSELYKNANVDIDENWITRVTEECNEIVNEFVSFETSNDTVDVLESDQSPSDITVRTDLLGNSIQPEAADSLNSDARRPSIDDLYDSDAEEVSQENVGNIDTLLDDANVENRNSTFTFAPG